MRSRGGHARPRRMALALVMVVAAAAAAAFPAPAAAAAPAANKTDNAAKLPAAAANANAGAAATSAPASKAKAQAPAANANAGATASTNKAKPQAPAAPTANNAKSAAAAKPAPPRPAGPLASSAILFYTKEYTEAQFGESKTRCEQLLESARAEGGSLDVNIVPTIYFEDDGSAPAGEPAAKTGPRATCKPDNWPTLARVGHFCFKKTWDAPCVAPSKADIDEFASGLQKCVATAARLGFRRVLLSPHIDDALGKGLWRNMVDFHPTDNDAKGNSYWSVLLGPLVKAGALAAKEAAAAASNSNNNNKGAPLPFAVWLGMQGEMGRPVFSDPAAWSATASKSRQAWAAAGASPDALKIGVLLPYRAIAGVNNYGPSPPDEPLSEPITPLSRVGGSDSPLPRAQWPLAPSFAKNAPALAALFRRDLDFLGVSNYVKSPAPVVTPADLDRAMRIAGEELRLASEGAPGGALDLSALMRGADAARKSAGKAPLLGIWSEFGVGGGRSRCGDAPAKSASEAGRWPHTGMFGSYTPESDPWAGVHAFPGAKEYRLAFHEAALKLLEKGGSDDFPLEAAYLWSITSWDPQAIHPASRAQGTGTARTGYWDGAVSGAIRRHNERAVAANGGKSA